MPRCKCGACFTITVLLYGLLMVYLFGKHFRENVTVFEIKGHIDNNEVSIDDKALLNQILPSGNIVSELMPKPQGSTQQAKRNVTKLVILTYMRSGSSLTGDLLQQHPEVFYVYEPIWQTQHNYLDGKPTTFLDGRVVNDLDPADYWTPRSISINVLKYIGDCQFSQLDIGTLMQSHMLSSKSTQPFVRCRRVSSVTKRHNDTTGLQKCLNFLIDPCSKAKVVAMKVIRFTMAQLEVLMDLDPDVKVIYLIRDPRGSLHSQSRVGEFKWNNVQNKSNLFCKRINEDIKVAKILTAMYPNKILTIRYEEIAEYPQAATQFIYNFLGLEMTDTIRKYIWNITYAGKQPNCQICTTRTNATETAYKWRDRMTLESAQAVQNECSEVFNTMGYRNFRSFEELVDRRNPTRSETYGVGLNTMELPVLKEIDAVTTRRR